MAEGPFPDYQRTKTINTSQVTPLGGYQLSKKGVLEHIRARIVVNGAIAGSERIRINAYSTQARTSPLWSTAWYSLSDIDSLSTYWVGHVVLSFDSKPFVDNVSTYWLGMEADNYTRNGYTYFIAARLVHPDTPKHTPAVAGAIKYADLDFIFRGKVGNDF